MGGQCVEREMKRINILEMFVGNKWMPEGFEMNGKGYTSLTCRGALICNGNEMRMKWRRRVGNGRGT